MIHQFTRKFYSIDPPTSGSGVWVKASERLPGASAWCEFQYKVDGNRSPGTLCNDSEGNAWFETNVFGHVVQEEDLSIIEWLDESAIDTLLSDNQRLMAEVSRLRDYLNHCYETITDFDPDHLTDEMHNNIKLALNK